MSDTIGIGCLIAIFLVLIIIYLLWKSLTIRHIERFDTDDQDECGI